MWGGWPASGWWTHRPAPTSPCTKSYTRSAHSTDVPFSEAPKLTALIRWQVGLPHVPVLHASVGADAGGDAPPAAAAQIAKLYGDALPSGVCLVLTSAATAAASFADAHVNPPALPSACD